jgi:hypothetical protein
MTVTRALFGLGLCLSLLSTAHAQELPFDELVYRTARSEQEAGEVMPKLKSDRAVVIRKWAGKVQVTLRLRIHDVNGVKTKSRVGFFEMDDADVKLELQGVAAQVQNLPSGKHSSRSTGKPFLVRHEAKVYRNGELVSSVRELGAGRPEASAQRLRELAARVQALVFKASPNMASSLDDLAAFNKIVFNTPQGAVVIRRGATEDDPAQVRVNQGAWTNISSDQLKALEKGISGFGRVGKRYPSGLPKPMPPFVAVDEDKFSLNVTSDNPFNNGAVSGWVPPTGAHKRFLMKLLDQVRTLAPASGSRNGLATTVDTLTGP